MDQFISQQNTGRRSITVSENALKRIEVILAAEDVLDQSLRVTVSGGGCSGYQYGFSLDQTIDKNDQVFEKNGVRVIIDEVSLDLLVGSEIDYVEDLIGSYFQVRNPNATASCGCGTSFSIG